MGQSKLISEVILKLKIAYPYFFEKLADEEFVVLTKMYQEQIVGYTPKIVLTAIDEIIATKKFMPSIAEILEKCDSHVKKYSCYILEKMKDDGYFKKGICTLDDAQTTKNYNKANLWLSKGIIPEWLLKDMEKYGFDSSLKLNNSERLLIDG